MKALSWVLTAKIIVTVLFWSIPLLVVPIECVRGVGFPKPEPEILLRLLGMAYSALAVGYIFGLQSARRGLYPKAIVWVGIVSNGGAFLILLNAASVGSWTYWDPLAQGLMWFSLAATGSIFVGLVACGPCMRNMSPHCDERH